MKIFILFLYFVFVPFTFGAPSGYKKVERRVAALWDSSEYSNADHYSSSLIHRHLEVVLNHYGLLVDYFDVNSDEFLQNPPAPDKYIALINWFIDDQAKGYLGVRESINRFRKANRKIALLGSLGFLYRNGDSVISDGTDDARAEKLSKEINNILNPLGLNFENNFFQTALGLDVIRLGKKEEIEFERSYESEIPKVLVFSDYPQSGKENKTLLKVRDKILGIESIGILFNDQVFFAQQGTVTFYNPSLDYTQWRLNPFMLVEWLAPKDIPIPDTTTIFGKRIFYSHIDGDGFINLTKLDLESFAGAIVKERVLDKYPFPIGISFIVNELKRYGESSQYFKLAQRIAREKYVELATHTYSHPLSWRQIPTEEEIKTYIENPKLYKGGVILSYPKGMDGKLDYTKEIWESIDYLYKKLLGGTEKEKTGEKVVYWSGSCVPPEEALRVVDKYNMLNINGGDSMFDKEHPSYAHLFPLGKKLGDYFQVYSSNTNEILYTNVWQGPYNGFKKVIETFENTENPIRIKPVNLYYHFYSADRLSGLNALIDIYKWIKAQKNLIKVFPSDYIKIVNDFPMIKVFKASNEFYIENAKNLKTFRMKYQNRIPDYDKSVNIIGHKVDKDQLYISLGSETEAKLVLKENYNIDEYILYSSDHLLSHFSAKGNIISIKGRGVGPGQLKVHGKSEKSFELPSGSYELELKVN